VPKPTAQRYFVTESGITVVTRDYSLFENPVTVDYFHQRVARRWAGLAVDMLKQRQNRCLK